MSFSDRFIDSFTTIPTMNFSSSSNRAAIKLFLSNNFTTNENKERVCKACINKFSTLAYKRLLSHLSCCEQVASDIKNEARAFISALNSTTNDTVFNFNDPYSDDERAEDDHCFHCNRPKKIAKADINTLIAKVFYSTGMSFRIADTAEWKQLFQSLNVHTPCSNTLKTTLLETNYLQLKQQMRSLIHERTSITIVTDGWKNVRGDHMVNYILCIPTLHPIFWKTEYTGNVAQTAQNIALGIENVMMDIGVERAAALVTDNAPNMKAAWGILKEKYPHLMCNGCSCHVINLIIKKIFTKGQYLEVLNQAKWLIKAVNQHTKALANFRDIQKQLRADNIIQQELELQYPCETRWHSQIDCLKRIQINQPVIMKMLVNGHFDADEDLPEIKFIIESQEFWNQIDEVLHHCEQFKHLIKVLESDNVDISFVCYAFIQLLQSDAPIWIIKIVKKKWKFLRTWSMLIGYFLNPIYHAGEGLSEDEFHTISAITNISSIEESNRYIHFSSQLTAEAAKMISDTGILVWWTTIGRARFPSLSILARRVFCIVTSNAPSERAWSIIDFIHSKRRNRLTNERIDKLAFLYMNNTNPDLVLDLINE